MSVSTQLRLIAKTEVPAPRATPRGGEAAARPLRARANTARRPARGRVTHWEGRWRLDEQTRAIGRAGVASARAALAAAHVEPLDDLRRAS